MHTSFFLLILFFSPAQASPLPILPLTLAPPNSWTAPLPLPGGGLYYGDIRAVIAVAPSEANTTLSAQIYWRRRDPTPSAKGVLIVNPSTTDTLPVLSATVESTCGVITFTPPTPGLYYAYYLPFRQVSPSDFWDIEFSWQGCNNTSPGEGNPCVLGGPLRRDAPSVCATATPDSARVLRLESRDAFNSFTDMEMMAAPSEAGDAAQALQASGAAFGVFCEGADLPVRVFSPPAADGSGGGIPVRWALRAGPPPTFSSPPTAPGTLLVFQVGLWAFAGSINNVTASASLPTLPTATFDFFNLGGIDATGVPFNTTWGVPSGGVGSLWVGLSLPSDAPPGSYSGTLHLSSNISDSITSVSVVLNITIADAPPSPHGGADDLSSHARLGWLNSVRGLEDTVPSPFLPVTCDAPFLGNPLTSLSALLKTISLGPTGLPTEISITAPKVVRGVPAPVTRQLLATPLAFELVGESGAVLPQVVSMPPTATALSNTSVAWEAAATATVGPQSTLSLDIQGSFDFSSIFTFAVTLTAVAADPVTLGNVRLTLPLVPSLAQYAMGLGKPGSNYSDFVWRWTHGTPFNKLWVGRPDAGAMLSLKGGAGGLWESPTGGVPFIPPSWGGSNTTGGVNVTGGSVTAFSGPCTLTPGTPLTFYFDLAITPSKPVDMGKHYGRRTVQVGYGTPYLSPQAVSAMGATIVTLHQGIPGVVNGSLVNPYINSPFGADVVPLLTNYTAQSSALGMATKFYYTVRELSHHAPDLFAFRALTGELLAEGDPYGSGGGGWNQHGGGAWLHQHLIGQYEACWQNPLSNGEWDMAVCDVGGSTRLFNYYTESLYWSMTNPPFINSTYYDGISFTRNGMLRVRRAVDAAAAMTGSKGAILDLHAGHDIEAPCLEYLTHLPLMDMVWTGEMYSWESGPEYYLIEVSAQLHGLTGDTLGCGEYPFRGLLFGMTERNHASATAIWASVWDAARISSTNMVGWWEDEPLVVVTHAPCSGSTSITISAPNCSSWNITRGGYWSSGSPCGSPNGNDGCLDPGTDLAGAQAHCCDDPLCAGFSFAKFPNGGGCYKYSQTCFENDESYDGYWKPGFVPPPPPPARTLATTFTAFGSHAIIVVATWCSAPGNATLAIDWSGLGLDPHTATINAPAVAGVQPAVGPFAIQGDGSISVALGGISGGIILVVTA